jgi:hypothetical protein
MKRLLLLLLLLIPSVASAQFTPLDLPDVRFYLPTSNLSRMEVSAGVEPTAAGDQILTFNAYGSAALVLTAPAAGNRPFLRSEATHLGALDFLNSTADRYMTADASAAADLKFLHGGTTGYIVLWVKADNATAAVSECIFDTRDMSTTNHGFSLNRATSERYLFNISTGASAANILHTTIYADTNWHSIIITIATGTGTVTMSTDGGAAQTSNFTVTSANDCSFPLRLGSKAGTQANIANTRIAEMVIGAGTLTAQNKTDWLAYNPALFTEPDPPAGTSPNKIGIGVGIGVAQLEKN